MSVDGKPYTTAVGETFAKYYSVYSVFNDQCVGVLYGDQSVTVCIDQAGQRSAPDRPAASRVATTRGPSRRRGAALASCTGPDMEGSTACCAG